MSFTEMESSAKTEKKVAAHPKVSVMVDTAIKTLADRKGSSLQAIYKYINANYNVDVQKLSTYIKKYLKSAVECGDLVQPKGKGASGSFKINKQKAEAKPKAPKVKSPKPLKMRTSTPKKTMKPKKAVAKVPSNSPVKKIKQTDEQDLADSTFTIMPNPKKAKKPKVSLPTKPRRSAVSLPSKVKKPKKLMSKKAKEPKVSVSPEGKSANKIKSPKPLKTKSAAKSPKDKKRSKAEKPASSNLKKAAPKKVFPKGG